MRSLSPLLIVLFFSSFLFAHAAPEAGSAVEKDKTLVWTFTSDPDLPNVLILGDSISIGYTLQVRALLADRANVFRPMGRKGNRRENCNGTGYGIANIDRWLAAEKWDVIHFNWGLHDLKHVKTAGTNDKSNDPNDPTQATLEEYTANMQVLIEKLKATGAELIFATTTPVVPGTLNPLRVPEAPVRYNATALEMMEANGIRVNDLHAYVLPHLDEWQLPTNVHFKPVGSNALAERVAAVIGEELTALNASDNVLAPKAVSIPVSHSSKSRPNIVFVYFDDMGYGQPQCYDPESALLTPNMDQLAKEGMRFTDGHSAAAVCTPSRYGVITGRYPSRIGQFGVCSPRTPAIIPTSRLTVASMLKQQGYNTALIGKWHLGVNWTGNQKGAPKVGETFTGGPHELGFDYVYGFTEARSLGDLFEGDTMVAKVAEVEGQPLMAAKAVEWINQQSADQPFFLYFPVCPPHAPVVPAPQFLGSGAKDVVKKDPLYGDWVFQGDAMLGQVMDALEANGFAENTLIIATADNGAAQRAYEPLKASKRSIYEGGHRVPFIARWPGKVAAGSIWNQTVCQTDLMATCAEITGATIPDNAGEDSVSMLPALLGQSHEPTRAFTVHQSMSGDLAIRQGPWKAIFLTSGKTELYQLEDDLGEKNDLSKQHPEKLKALTDLMQGSIDSGRSTPGQPQPLEFSLTLGARKKITKALGD
ncbi:MULTISPECIES: sulfatase-like hydrolase/transferase [unclassified Lentimonas]|uniref:sulfatase-like hydrolase/transferase n=1 Tax=unclassified Lentimonas TaxID=2630993 RepID=UPI001325F5C8|nr:MULTISPECIES: sulfatase-like hydrolase/transferase [unclassified Lentimonas]CAA6676340.1 Choline-sulfatase (EC [Lentimonas sp. CC4]CAA6683770.1 Choline-sulfatase (EC [Lentimonas sp. CC6]CAA7077835.1 Choline-sulfatase (EC [Lentimonas sp. CC4]CAA7169765.1 Choline-sulfatase (EC [Lentimonas sp. CC21]CAA7179883.1 Choline-sulfatase (EC [Lentimonas sp. CC8]